MHEDLIYKSAYIAKQAICLFHHVPSVMETLSMLLRLEGFEVLCATSLDNVIEFCEQRRPRIALLPLQEQEEKNRAMAATLKSGLFGTSVFMIADPGQARAAVHAIKSGTDHVLILPLRSEELLATVRAEISKDLSVDYRGRVIIKGFSTLTPREREVLNGILEGWSNREIAQRIGNSPRTVEVHRARLMNKLGARNTADLVRRALTR